jgi:2-hydroxy-3-keto-5-methylthiopentenyl-1-phosphate phosphatase
MLQSYNKETLKEYLMDKLKRKRMFNEIMDDQVSEEDALAAVRAAIQVNLGENYDVSELLLQNKIISRGMLSGRNT